MLKICFEITKCNFSSHYGLIMQHRHIQFIIIFVILNQASCINYSCFFFTLYVNIFNSILFEYRLSITNVHILFRMCIAMYVLLRRNYSQLDLNLF